MITNRYSFSSIPYTEIELFLGVNVARYGSDFSIIFPRQRLIEASLQWRSIATIRLVVSLVQAWLFKLSCISLLGNILKVGRVGNPQMTSVRVYIPPNSKNKKPT